MNKEVVSNINELVKSEIPHNEKSEEQKIKEYRLGVKLDFEDFNEADRLGYEGLRELEGGMSDQDEYYYLSGPGFIGKIRENKLVDEHFGKVENLPSEAQLLVLYTWETVSPSPFSNSIYNNKEKTWHYTKQGTLRVSDHLLGSEKYKPTPKEEDKNLWHLMEFNETEETYVQEIPLDEEEYKTDVNKYLDILKKYITPLQEKYKEKFTFSNTMSLSRRIHHIVTFPRDENLLSDFQKIIDMVNKETKEQYDESFFSVQKGNKGYWTILRKY